MDNNKPRTFARIFETAQYGQILILATTNDDDDPCLQFTVDTHPYFLKPTTISLSFSEDHDQYASLAEFTQERAEAFAKDIHKQASMFVPAPKEAP